MITKNVTLWFGSGPRVTIPVSQYDTMWQFVFSIINNSVAWPIPADSDVVMNGRKADGNTFSFGGTVSNGVATVNSDIQMTAAAGLAECELTVMNSGKVVGTANFYLAVEPAPKAEGDISSETTLPAYAEILDEISQMTGAMLPAGGNTNQVLAKKSNSDYDVEWKTGGGGVSDVKVNTTSVVSGGVATIPLATASTAGAVTVATTITSTGTTPVRSSAIYTALANKADSSSVHSIPSGGTTGQVLKKTSNSDYAASWANESGGGGAVDDVQINGNSIVTSGTATIPVASSSAYGVAKISDAGQPGMLQLAIETATTSYVPRLDSNSYVPYGLLPGVPETTVSSSGAVSQALGAQFIYHFTGELTSLTISLTAAPTGRNPHYHFDFVSGSTAVTLTMPIGVTMPSGFSVAANTRYEIDILNNYAVVQSWAVSAS